MIDIGSAPALLVTVAVVALTFHAGTTFFPTTAIFLFALYFNIDVNAFLRTIWIFIHHHTRKHDKPIGILETVPFASMLWVTDLDFMVHMNNARYPRACDFARYKLWNENGVLKATHDLGGYTVLGASTIRYRKSINPFETFSIDSRVVCWDEKAFYVEQRFVRNGFVKAIFFAKQNIVKVPVSKVLEKLGIDPVSPPPPEHFRHWMAFDKECSVALREEANRSS